MLRMIQRFVYAYFLAIDLLASAMTFGAPWQTLSARFAKSAARGSKIGKAIQTALDWIVLKLFSTSRHCEVALEAYEARMNASVEIG
jgi:hypothetical protein